ncbi:CU044_5270 family protein [Micromonospora chersina]|uniref:CU044_5270 family protein n=1 Tax=Micromonospora chersina TaxID=47854 RepID=UPI003799D27A
MNSDLKLLRELGEGLKPAVGQPPASLRHRVLAGARQAQVRPTRRTWWGEWSRSPRWRLLSTAATAVVAAVAVTALVLPSVGRGGRQPADPEVVVRTPAQVLELAAARVAAAPALTPRGDQFVFTEWVEVVQRFRVRGSQIVASVDKPEMVRQWRSVDGSGGGLVQRRSEAGVWRDAPLPVPPCGEGYASHGKDRQGKTDECGSGYGGGLPTDGDAMYDYLYRSSGLPDGLVAVVGADVPALARAAELLRLGGLSPQVQAAVFDAIGRMPGVQVKTDAVDVAGRSGLALVFEEAGGETELIFDSRTYEYLGMNQEIFTAWRPVPGKRAAWVVADTPVRQAVLRVAVVKKAGELP